MEPAVLFKNNARATPGKSSFFSKHFCEATVFTFTYTYLLTFSKHRILFYKKQTKEPRNCSWCYPLHVLRGSCAICNGLVRCFLYFFFFKFRFSLERWEQHSFDVIRMLLLRLGLLFSCLSGRHSFFLSLGKDD